jgi:hypothetical protein
MNRDPHVVPALAGRQRRSRLKAGLQTTPSHAGSWAELLVALNEGLTIGGAVFMFT